ncbi:MAG TPA: hypothetical protein VF062_10325 [Candidatus Limnocylindrales bacterium]
MIPLIALSLLQASFAPVSAAPVEVHVRTTQVSVLAGGAVQEFTLDCAPGDWVLSGGFRHAAAALRIRGSHPSPAKPAWVVSAVNPGITAVELALTVVCAAGEVRSAVKMASGSSLRASTQCAQGSVVTGGGYSSNGAEFIGSHPAVGEGWAVTAVAAADSTAPPEVSVYAVCVSGAVEPGDAGWSMLEVGPSGSASQVVMCDGQLVGGGYEMSEEQPAATPFSVVEAAVGGGAWRVGVSGRGADNQPFSVRLVAICVQLPGPGPGLDTGGLPVGQEPVAERDEILPIIGGSCLVSALLLALILVMSARMRSRSRRGAQAQVAVVLRAHHSSFRMDEFREVQ